MGLLKDKALINGEWVNANSNKTFEVRNPANGDLVGTVPHMDGADTELAIKAAHDAFKTWQSTTVTERSKLLKKWLHLLKENAGEINKIISAETGRTDSTFELNGGAEFLEYYAEEAKRLHGEILPDLIPNKKMYVERQPIGVVGLITPWNVPYSMLLRKAAPALAAGCTCVIKPPEDTPLSTLSAVQLAHEAGIPKGVINVITCDRENASAVGKALCSSPLIAGISFTGSSQVGKILYGQCAQQIKRISLELGGNSPLILFKSGDINKAVQLGTHMRLANNGQICIASNRYLIHEDHYDDYVTKLQASLKTFPLGPLINKNQIARVESIVQDAKDKGAKILLGGKRASEKGELFYEATLIVDVNKDMRVYKEEIFGPVACIYKFKTEEEAIEMANDTERGLAAYFFSQDLSQIYRVSKALETGILGINDFAMPVESPFGGIKESGIGKEGSRHGLEEFTYMKYICIGGL